jgi:hypothetical protein
MRGARSTARGRLVQAITRAQGRRTTAPPPDDESGDGSSGGARREQNHGGAERVGDIPVAAGQSNCRARVRDADPPFPRHDARSALRSLGYPLAQLGAGVDAELAVDAGQVGLDRLRAQ